MSKEDSICHHCNNRFRSKRKEYKYCSKVCRDAGRAKTLSITLTGRDRPSRKTGKNIQCQHCGSFFYVPKHKIDTAKYCSKACMYEGLKSPSHICSICGKTFWKKNINKNRKYCSRKCASMGRCIGNYVKCENCKKEIYKPQSYLAQSQHHFCSRQCANQWQGRNKNEYICKICGKKFYLSQSIEKHSQYEIKYCSIECRDKDPEKISQMIEMNLRQQQKGGLNKLEQKGHQILNDLNVNYEEQILIANKFCVDVVLPDNMIIIQWDGDYWHGNPAKFIQLNERQAKRVNLDRSQDAYLSKCGYKVLRFWETDVYNNANEVKAKILEVLKNE